MPAAKRSPGRPKKAATEEAKQASVAEKPQKVAVEVVAPEKAKIEATINEAQANVIHSRLRERVGKAANRLAADLIEIARDLKEIQDTNAWIYYAKSWSEYLENHREFSRAYMFNLARLGHADESTFKLLADKGVGATQMIEYAKIAPEPQQIGKLVEETWERVNTLPVRQMKEEVKAKVVELFPAKEAPKTSNGGKKRGRKPKTWLDRFADLFMEVPVQLRESVGKEVRRYILEQLKAVEIADEHATITGADPNEVRMGLSQETLEAAAAR